MEPNGSTDTLLLVMRQQQSRYAVPAENVEEIISVPALTALPRQPGYLRGIFNYKGHVIPVLSLRALCGCGTGGDEAVCVVLRMEDLLLALTADGAESLVTDSGQRVQYDESLMEGEFVKLACVLPGDPAILVLDPEKVYGAVEAHFNAETFA